MQPLEGVRVVELGQNIAAPFGAEILASLGADVVKVERPGGDDARAWGSPATPDASILFHVFNANKRGIALDLKDKAAVDWLRAFIGESDIVIQNLRAGVVEELGLDAATLRAAYPRLIYCSLWAYGHKGPMKMGPGYEPIVQAYSGMFSINGAPEGPPARVGMSVLDMGTGLWGALGCLAALIERQKTGKGCTIDASLFETSLGWMRSTLANYFARKTLPVRHRSGSAGVMVFQAFETTDGEIVIGAGNDRLFAKLAEVLGKPEWNADPRFKTNPARVRHRDILLPQIDAIMRTRPRAEWQSLLERAGVPCAPVNSFVELAKDPHLAAMDVIEKVPGVDLEVVGLPLSFNGERPKIRSRAPTIGEHNAEIVGDALGPRSS